MAADNHLFVISPYSLHGTWVFDDPQVGLVQEPFVAGVPEIINRFLEQTIGKVDRFRLLFSASPFPGYQIKLDRCEGESCGQWYEVKGDGMKGWLCPALFKYFDAAPEAIYAKAERIDGGATKEAGTSTSSSKAQPEGREDAPVSGQPGGSPVATGRKPKPDFNGTIRGFLPGGTGPDDGMIVFEVDEEAQVLAAAGGYETAESFVAEEGYLCQHAAMIPSNTSTSMLMTMMATGQPATVVHDAQGKCEIVIHVV